MYRKKKDLARPCQKSGRIERGVSTPWLKEVGAQDAGSPIPITTLSKGHTVGINAPFHKRRLIYADKDITTMKRQALWLAAMLAFNGSVFGGAMVKPNIVIIFTDDQGYADVGKFWRGRIRDDQTSTTWRTRARYSGIFTSRSQFCSASRAALLTAVIRTGSAFTARCRASPRSVSLTVK